MDEFFCSLRCSLDCFEVFFLFDGEFSDWFFGFLDVVGNVFCLVWFNVDDNDGSNIWVGVSVDNGVEMEF